MKIAIVGSTELTERQTIYADHMIYLIIDEYIARDLEIVSGGARGIDTRAVMIAQYMAVAYKEFLPEKHEWSPSDGGIGFKARNLQVAEYCDKLYSIRSTKSTTYGSGWTADQAEKLGKDVYRYYV